MKNSVIVRSSGESRMRSTFLLLIVLTTNFCNFNLRQSSEKTLATILSVSKQVSLELIPIVIVRHVPRYSIEFVHKSIKGVVLSLDLMVDCFVRRVL